MSGADIVVELSRTLSGMMPPSACLVMPGWRSNARTRPVSFAWDVPASLTE